ncbi:uncharacterized protein LOC111117768 [Crassostrea virginica]|uniref:Uncharacterized protein LOC111117768 n=1 Tax=Crassostrea virginica TaxID=6565 RepID=A0A8B8CAP1_CRAVI|nr:uncharacterized protein LOC111117768 [Crassostrea virginica]XP_022312721.1 uncharacterized protein LOC111117768 [Crassostrea virginica]
MVSPVSLSWTRLLTVVCTLSLCVAGYTPDYQDSLSEDRGSIPRTKFLQNFIRTLRNSDLDPGLPLRALVPRGYSTGRYEGIPDKRDYGINPPFHELCRMLNMPYCAYRS